jgi:hypothetical protein
LSAFFQAALGIQRFVAVRAKRVHARIFKKYKG